MLNQLNRFNAFSKLFILSLALLFSTIKLSAFQNQFFDWAVNGGYSTAAYVATDPEGNVFVTGNFVGVATFGSTMPGTEQVLSAVAVEFDQDGYLAKYTTEGVLIWVRQISGVGHGISQAISVDSSGNVFITGYFSEEVTFESLSDTNDETRNVTGDQELFLAKYDTDGNLLWVEITEGSEDSQTYGYGVDVDMAGNAYLTGVYHSSVEFGAETMGSETVTSPASEFSIFVAKYLADGTFEWVEIAEGPLSIGKYSLAISVDLTGNSHITGYFDEATFGGTTTITAIGDADLFVAKYDTDGNFLWVIQEGGASYDSGNSIVVDADGNTYITGTFYESATFGEAADVNEVNLMTPQAFQTNLFVAKYDADGLFLWVRSVTSSLDGGTYGTGIALGLDGGPIVTGHYNIDAIFGTDTMLVANPGMFSPSTTLVAKYTPDGDFIWAKTALTNNNMQAQSIAVDYSENIFVSGYFTIDATFDETMLAVADQNFVDHFYVAKLLPQQPAPIPTMGEWALLILLLSIAIMGLVALSQKQRLALKD